MLDGICQIKTCLKMFEIEDEISLFKGGNLTESEWTTFSYLLELWKAFKVEQPKIEGVEQPKIEGDQCVTIRRVASSHKRFMAWQHFYSLGIAANIDLPDTVKGFSQNP
jgi:hypothetical protein